MIRAVVLIFALSLLPVQAAETEPEVQGTVWLDLDEGLARAKETGFPLLVWMAPSGCAECGAKSFEDPEVIEVLADFVPVRTDLAHAAGLDLDISTTAVVLMDSSGAPLPDLSVEADETGALPTDAIIDLMSSGLDVVR